MRFVHARKLQPLVAAGFALPKRRGTCVGTSRPAATFALSLFWKSSLLALDPQTKSRDVDDDLPANPSNMRLQTIPLRIEDMPANGRQTKRRLYL